VLAQITKLGKQQVVATRQLVKDNNLLIENYFSKAEVKELIRLFRKLNHGLDQCQPKLKN
jgi:hypothetical protein